jgi:hypothetical protein
MRRVADLMDWEAIRELSADSETGDKACAALGDVPVSRDLLRVFLIRDRIEDRLTNEPGWPSPPT